MAMILNGYEIDKYNIHEIKEGATASTCPECSHNRKKSSEKCMSVFWDTGLGQCNHCGARVQLHTYKTKQSYKNYFVPIEIPKSEVSPKVLKYFKDTRGISEGTLNHLKIRDSRQWMPKAQKEIDVIEFRYYLHGKLVNTKFRGANKDFKFIKDAKIIPYNIDSILGSTIAYICEGEVDCCSVVESGLQGVISVPNGFTLPRKDGTSTINMEYLDDFIDYFEKVDKIVLATDADEAGKHGRDELIRRLGSDKCYTVDFGDCKDANEYLVKYGKERLRVVLDDYKPLPLENVKTIADTWDSLKDFWRNGRSRGYTIGLREMDDSCSFVFSQYTLLVSAANSGKSEKLDDITIRLNTRYGLKVAYCSPENDPVLHHDKWFRKIYGKAPVGQDIDSFYVNGIKGYIEDNFFSVVDTSDLDATLNKFRELYKRKGVKIFVLDPFNRVRFKGVNRSDVNEYTERYHLELDKFVKETDSHLFLALHPVKIKPEADGKTYPIPSAYDSKGGGEHFDMSYNILGMSRDFAKNAVNFRVLKWKYSHLGTVGKEWMEFYNVESGRYCDFAKGREPSAEGSDYKVEWDNKPWVEPVEEVKELFEKPSAVELIDSFEQDVNFGDSKDVKF